MESVLTYVHTPTQMRVRDIRDMVAASHDGAHARAMGHSVFHAANMAHAHEEDRPL